MFLENGFLFALFEYLEIFLTRFFLELFDHTQKIKFPAKIAQWAQKYFFRHR